MKCIGLITFILISLIIFTYIVLKPNHNPKNVILLLADDLGWKDLACTGSDVYLTPNLDKLAANGFLFENSYAASCVCSPTRVSVLTGKSPARLGLTSWVSFSNRETTAPPNGYGPHSINQLPLEEMTIAEAFNKHGYRTGMIGKWHLGNEMYWPDKQGFDYSYGKPFLGTPKGGYYLPNKIQLTNFSNRDYLTDHLAEAAVNFIKKNTDKPFFLYHSFYSVHRPIQAKAALLKEESVY